MPFPPLPLPVTLNGTRTTAKHKLSVTGIEHAIKQLSVGSVVVCLLFTGLLLYLCAPLIRVMTAPKTAVAEEYLSQSCYTLQGIIIREETPIPSVEIGAVSVVESGQAVAASAPIAVCGDRSILTPIAGIYLHETDGFEHLTANMLSEITPSELDQLQRSHAADSSCLGKIISGNSWLIAAVIPSDHAAALQEGKPVVLSAYGDDIFALTATVIHISTAENDSCAVVFRCIDYLLQTAHLRHLTFSLPPGRTEGLRIPTQAVQTDEAGSFVYTRSVSGAEKTYVTILSEEDDFCIVSKDSSARALRAGDTILIGASNLKETLPIK